MKVVQNFLDINEFKVIQNIIMSKGGGSGIIPYFFQNFVAYEDATLGDSYFTHTLYELEFTRTCDLYVSNRYTDILKPILRNLQIKSLTRAKINLYPRTNRVVEHKPHSDYPYTHKGCVFSINTCDGYTRLGDKKIPSIENQAIFFDSSIPHNSTTCTNDKARFNININYF